MSIITDIGHLIEKLGEWVKGVFSASEKVYDKLSEEEKKGAVWAYGVIAFVNRHKGEALPYIKLAYPDLSDNVLQDFISKLLIKVKYATEPPLTLKEALEKLGEYLGQFEGDAWKVISQAAGTILAVMYSPATSVQKFMSIAEMVYNLIVKPKVKTLNEVALGPEGGTYPNCNSGYTADPVNKRCVKDPLLNG